ncbi:IPT/TIG domain-containing protein [Deinococcus maricopensis]|uniref:Cell surface receptor IPT/TIG domain protein n=1 Tax=Deinococcus maricopensis (strain DSM 21211 / LMG 22137 / NRRL B-23946 / LB-34) TaxID=709986 RepID=E8U8T8_DEIML|nr:IPT/TIG domain-containing protein [Deinococcus maricopensis]ADV67477.1 cell surface receptor IPT/TIG domain protein [Deinococcus maricopensis DSM 21211]
MKVLLVSGILLAGALASCAPRANTVVGVTVTPMVVKVSEGAQRGQTVTVQGRYLGGPSTGRILLGATESGADGYVVPASDIVSWTDTEIQFRVPANAVPGAGWLFVRVNNMLSTGLPFSVRQ